MAATFQDLNTIASDSNFRGRCMYALQVASIAVMTESAETPSHAQRSVYASLVIQGSVNSYLVALAVLTNATIANEASLANISSGAGIIDSDIQYAINTIFNALSGITTS